MNETEEYFGLLVSLVVVVVATSHVATPPAEAGETLSA